MDSLRQLAMKFLQKKEGEKYHFQKDFLMPFYDTWKKCHNFYTKEYIIICINNLLNNYSKNIKSGWDVILSIFKEVAKMDNEENIQKQILNVLYDISKNNYNEIKDIFKDLTSCLIEFTSKHQEEVMKIIENFVEQVEDETNFNILLECYKSFITDNDEKIRNEGLNNLLECFNKKFKNPKSNLYLSCKKEKFWEFILIQLLINIVEELKVKITILSINNNNQSNSSTFYTNYYSNSNTIINNNEFNTNNNNYFNNNIEYHNDEKEKLSAFLQKLLIKIGDLFNDYFSYNYKFLGKFFEELESLVFYYEEKVQSASLECIIFLNESEKMKNMSFLRPYVLFLTKLADKSLEKDFLNIDMHILKYDYKKYNDIIDINIFYCYLHLKILTLLDKLIEENIDILGEDDLNKILNCLENSFDISIKFNKSIELRLLITDNLKSGNIVVLFKQMQISIKIYFFILEHLFNDNSSFQSKQNYYKKMIETSIKILNNFAESNKEYYDIINKPLNKNRDEREIKEKEKIIKHHSYPITNQIFPIMEKVLFFKFDKYKELITKSLLELIICQNEEIRKKVKEILSSIYNKLT